MLLISTDKRPHTRWLLVKVGKEAVTGLVMESIYTSSIFAFSRLSNPAPFVTDSGNVIVEVLNVRQCQYACFCADRQCYQPLGLTELMCEPCYIGRSSVDHFLVMRFVSSLLACMKLVVGSSPLCQGSLLLDLDGISFPITRFIVRKITMNLLRNQQLRRQSSKIHYVS